MKGLSWVTMRKGFALFIAILLAMGVALVFMVSFFGQVPLGEPMLRTEFYPPPPWQVRPGDSLEVAIGIANDAWLLAWAKDIRVAVTMPEGFTSSHTGTNQCVIDFGSLHGGDGIGSGLTIRVSSNISHGNYTVTVKVSGQNFPEKIFTPVVTVAS